MLVVTKKKSVFTLVLIFALVFAGCKNPADSGTVDNSTVVPNIDDEVRACFNLVNQFRTGNEAFYWNEDNTTKTNLVGKLGRLTLDEDLCKAAQIRANEIIKKFDHVRPNGKRCETVLDDCSISYRGWGENIAAGNRTGSATFIQWKEDDENYSGQGHRRNMLGDFTKIGIAYTYNANSPYRYYWAMILTK